MAKLHYTGVAEAPVTFENKYQVETDAIIDVDDQDVDVLLATGRFEKAGGSGSGGSGGSKSKKAANANATNDSGQGGQDPVDDPATNAAPSAGEPTTPPSETDSNNQDPEKS